MDKYEQAAMTIKSMCYHPQGNNAIGNTESVADYLRSQFPEPQKIEGEKVCTECLRQANSKCNTCEGVCSRTKEMQNAIVKIKVNE